MKKVLSLILVVCMAFSCLALSACVWEGIFGTTTSTVPTASTTQPTTKPTTSTTTTTTTTTTTIPDDGGEPEDLVIQHGDNFTEEDIEFVKSLQGEYTGPSGDHRTYSFEAMIGAGKAGDPIYHITLDVDNPYFICAYVNYSDDINLIYLDVSQYTWYKFYDIDNMPSYMNDEQRRFTYVLYSGIVIKNICDNTIYNYPCVFYHHTIPKDGFFRLQECNSNIILSSCGRLSLDTDYPIFLPFEAKTYQSFPVYSDIHGNDYMYFTYYEVMGDGEDKQVHYFSNAKEMLGKYYDTLSPYFEELPVAGNKGIDLQVMINILLEHSEDSIYEK